MARSENLAAFGREAVAASAPGASGCAETGGGSPKVNQETLRRELLGSARRLRCYVDRRIPERLRPAVSADDVLQETWIAAHQALSKFTPDGPDAIGRWLTTIANSKLVNAIRAARRFMREGARKHLRDSQRRLSSFADLFARVQSPQKTPSSEFRAAERAHAASIALSQLTDDRRRAVHLHYIEGRSRREVARAMGRSEAAVNSLLYNGLLELRSLLGDAASYFSDVDSSEPDESGAPRSG
jgi:RNA polymerase sigma factor (sigma-70 family)